MRRQETCGNEGFPSTRVRRSRSFTPGLFQARTEPKSEAETWSRSANLRVSVASLAIHDQCNVVSSQVERYFRRIELHRDGAQRHVVFIRDTAYHKIGRRLVQPGDTERMVIAATQCIDQIGTARVDHAHDAVRLVLVAGRHRVVRHIVHVDTGVAQIAAEFMHEVADFTHQRILRELRCALLAREPGQTW